MRLPFLRRPGMPALVSSGVNEPQPANYQVARIESQDDLICLAKPVRRMLADEFDIGASSNRFCPMQLEDGSVAIATVEDYHDSEQVDELERMVLRRQYRLAQPSRLIVPATLLLALVRGQVAGTRVGNPRHGSADVRRSSMVDAFHDMVAWGVEHDASDMHLNVRTMSEESEVRFTVGGQYVAPARFARMPTVTMMEILSVAWMDIQGGNGAVFDPAIEQQGRLRLQVRGRPVMLRWASLSADGGVSVCLRILLLDRRVCTSFHDLGYLPSQIDMMDRARCSEGGAIVLAGVVGSGKSTTIAAMMSMIPETRKVVTLEDPVEYLIPGALQNTVTRTLDGERRDSFDAKLRTTKRSAMNDLLVGEIRDRETGRAFMDVAGSGTSLYTTVHAGAAMLIPDRLASDFIGVSRDFLATPGILKLLVYQALLPLLCQHCALDAPEEGSPGRTAWQRCRERIASLYDVDVSGLRVRNPHGCAVCSSHHLPELNGFAGRTVVAEMIEPGVDDDFLLCVRRGDNIEQRRRLARQRRAAYDNPDMSGKTAMECAVYKALNGLVDPRDIEARFQSFDTVALERQWQD